MKEKPNIRPFLIGITPGEEEMFRFLDDYTKEQGDFGITFVPEELNVRYSDNIKELFYRFMLILTMEKKQGVH